MEQELKKSAVSEKEKHALHKKSAQMLKQLQNADRKKRVMDARNEIKGTERVRPETVVHKRLLQIQQQRPQRGTRTLVSLSTVPSITGTVTDSNGDPLEDIEVDIYNNSGGV